MTLHRTIHFQHRLGRLSHPLLAVTSSVVASPARRRRHVHCADVPTCIRIQTRGICHRRLGLGITVQAREIPPHSSRAPSLDSAPPPTVSSAPTEPRSRPRPINLVPPPLSRPAGSALHSSFTCARADTTHTHTPALRLSIIDSNSERLATSGAATTPSSGTPGPSLRHTYRVGVHSSRP
ncbi:hypothetical protein C8R45DRAFT_1089242 [Mycena sanguinolenta]|nr:hypothetical protein C8R45DRAFT_1089242 [Mycena sanguinolenta]